MNIKDVKKMPLQCRLQIHLTQEVLMNFVIASIWLLLLVKSKLPWDQFHWQLATQTLGPLQPIQIYSW